MHAIIEFLKAAVDRSDMPGINGCYIIRGGSIYAYSKSGGIQAGVAMPSTVDFNVPAPALDAALSRMKEIQSLTVDEDVVTIKAGRLRSAIRLNTTEPPDLPEMPTDWKRTPPSLAYALTAAKDHLGEEGWQTCIRLMENRVTSFRPASGIDISVPGLLLDPCLLTEEVFNFLIAQGGSDEYCQEKNVIWFRWEDGRWLRAQYYSGEMPEGNIAKIFETCGNEIPVDVTPEFREALADAAAMSDKYVGMTAKGFEGRTGDVGVNLVECKIKGLPPGHASVWDKKYLLPVIERATGWNPTTWPAPSYFEGPDVRGVIMGRSRW